MPSTKAFSVITPTYQREGFLPKIAQCFLNQTYPHKEWLILDDSPQSSRFFQTIDNPQIKYQWMSERLTLGEKLNWLNEQAQGELICHFDDDDFYAPQYLETLAKYLAQADFVKPSAWHIYHQPSDFWGYFDTQSLSDSCFVLTPGEPVREQHPFELDETMKWGWGFAHAYNHKLWAANPFEPVTFGTDYLWVFELLKQNTKIHTFPDKGLVLHIIRSEAVSQSFAQTALKKEEVPKELLLLTKDFIEV